MTDKRKEFNKLRNKFIYKLEQGCCNCGKEATQLHHVIPLSLGGNNIDSNIVPLCEECHYKLHHNGKETNINHSKLTKEGIETARLNGKQIGLKKGTKLTTKKSILAKEQIIKYSKDFNGTLKDIEVMKLIGIARNSYYKYKKELIG